MEVKKYIGIVVAIVSILILGIGGYYFLNLKKGPFPASDLMSISYKWGVGDTLVNSYESANSSYQYLDNRDSLIKKKLKLSASNFIFLHSKANEANLWQLPDTIANTHADLKSIRVLRYEITFNYRQKSKKIVFMTDYKDELSISESFGKIQSAIEQTLKERE